MRYKTYILRGLFFIEKWKKEMSFECISGTPIDGKDVTSITLIDSFYILHLGYINVNLWTKSIIIVEPISHRNRHKRKLLPWTLSFEGLKVFFNKNLLGKCWSTCVHWNPELNQNWMKRWIMVFIECDAKLTEFIFLHSHLHPPRTYEQRSIFLKSKKWKYFFTFLFFWSSSHSERSKAMKGSGENVQASRPWRTLIG